MADEYALSHKTSETGTINNGTRHNPSAKSYQSKGHRLNDRGAKFLCSQPRGICYPRPDSQSNNISRGGSGNYDSRGNRGSSSNVSRMRCSFCQSPTRELHGPPNHAHTRPAGPRACLNPHMNLYPVSAPAPHPQKLDPHPPRTRTIFFRPAATRKTY